MCNFYGIFWNSDYRRYSQPHRLTSAETGYNVSVYSVSTSNSKPSPLHPWFALWRQVLPPGAKASVASHALARERQDLPCLASRTQHLPSLPEASVASRALSGGKTCLSRASFLGKSEGKTGKTRVINGECDKNEQNHSCHGCHVSPIFPSNSAMFS